MYGAREHMEGGGLISYAPNFLDLYRRAADHVDKILRGEKPADLPVEQPTKFDSASISRPPMRSASTVPPTLLARADEVIEYRMSLCGTKRTSRLDRSDVRYWG